MNLSLSGLKQATDTKSQFLHLEKEGGESGQLPAVSIFLRVYFYITILPTLNQSLHLEHII